MRTSLRVQGLILSFASVWTLGLELSFGADYPSTVLADGPIAYYRFSDMLVGVPAPIAHNSGSLGTSADGLYMNGAAPGVEAPRPPAFIGFEADNMALQLDGVDDFVGTLVSLLNDKPRFTLSAWIRRGGPQAARAGLFGQNDLVEFGYVDDATLQCWTDANLDVANPFPDGEWDYVAIVSEGSPGTITMYTNGLVAGFRSQVLPTNNFFHFNIGGGGIFDAAVTNFFNGQIDEVAVFDKALSAERIGQHYTTAKATPPTIFRQPVGTNVFEGADVTLSVGVIGTAPLRLQWLNFGSPIKDETNSTLVFHNITLDQASTYSVHIENDYDMVDSDPVDVNVMPTEPPTITQEPQSVTRYAGRNITFKVRATGGSHLAYQWLSNSVDIANATNNMLMLANVQQADAAGYSVIVTNSIGAVTSMVATLTVIVPTPGTYEALIVADNPFAYWRFDETNGSTVAHDYIGGYDGTYTDVTLEVPGALAGNSDTAADFNGTSSAVTTVSGLMNSRPTFTLTGWMRRAGDQRNRTGLWGQNDLIEFGYINNNTLEAWTDNGLDVSPNPIPNLEWAHLVVVSDGSPGTITMYTNGSPALSRSHFLPDNNNFSFNIGGGGVFDGTGNFFFGQIDEVALFDRALTPSQICALYFSGSGAPLRISITLGGLIFDTKPSGTPHHGHNFGAHWFDSNTDVTAITRQGVMQFVAAEPDQIVLPPAADFNSPTGTITFWMRSLATTGSGDFGAILFDRRPSNPGGPPGDVIVQQDDGHLFVQAASGSGGANSFSSTANVTDDAWHHVAYVYDQSATGSITFFIDGVQDMSQTNSAAWSWTPTQQIELGKSHDSFWRAFDGYLDDFRIYNRILTASEIADVAGNGAIVDPAALVVRFNFDTAPGGATLSWPCGALECTTSLNPVPSWAPVVGASSPYFIETSAPMRFYRVHP